MAKSIFRLKDVSIKKKLGFGVGGIFVLILILLSLYTYIVNTKRVLETSQKEAASRIVFFQGIVAMLAQEGEFKLDDINKIAKDYQSEEYHLLLFTKSGQVVFSPMGSNENETIKRALAGAVFTSGGGVQKISEFLFATLDPQTEVVTAIKLDEIRMKNQFNRLLRIISVSISIVILLVILVMYYLVKDLSGGVNRAIGFADEIGKGNLMVRYEDDRQDEIGYLANSLNKMGGQLQSIVYKINGEMDDLETKARLLNTSSISMSEGANIQASGAEEASAAMEEMAANIHQNSSNAISARERMEMVTTGIHEGISLSEKVRAIMENIEEKTSLITDIARQTNILSLNAAIEAARAGDSGRGFAVVASEIRRLAEKSRNDAAVISSLVHQGFLMVAENEQKLTSLAPALNETLENMREIAAASEEQNIGAEQVNAAILELNKVTQQSAAISDEFSSSSQDFLKIADSLQGELSYFKIEKSV